MVPLFRDFLNLLFPKWCAGCLGPMGSGEETICVICRSELKISSTFREMPNEITGKFYGKIPVAHAFTMFKFKRGGIVQNLLHRLKYEGYYELGVWLGQLLGREIKAEPWTQEIDLIVPIPLHKKKLQIRGYNQSEAFASGLGGALEKPVNEVLNRKEFTKSQTRKSRLERWKNVSEVFEVEDIEFIKGKNALLVDDVITSGATLEAAGHQLKKAGVGSIFIATIASA